MKDVLTEAGALVNYYEETNTMDIPFEQHLVKGLNFYFKYDVKFNSPNELYEVTDDDIFERREHVLKWEEEILEDEEEEEDEESEVEVKKKGKGSPVKSKENISKLGAKKQENEPKVKGKVETKEEPKELISETNQENNTPVTSENQLREGNEVKEEVPQKKYRVMTKTLNYKVFKQLQTRSETVDLDNFLVCKDVNY